MSNSLNCMKHLTANKGKLIKRMVNARGLIYTQGHSIGNLKLLFCSTECT